jgi:hypothetical protein
MLSKKTDHRVLDLVGGWKCISFEVFSSDSPSKTLIAKPHGDSPLGRVLISRNGYLSAHMAKPDRMHPLYSGKAWQEGSSDEVAHVARGLSMYCGYLELFEDADGLFWRTRVEVCSDPASMGGVQERRVRYFSEGGREFMVLKPKGDMVMEVSCLLLTRL